MNPSVNVRRRTMQSPSEPRVCGSRYEPQTSRTADMAVTLSTATFENENILTFRASNGVGNKNL